MRGFCQFRGASTQHNKIIQYYEAGFNIRLARLPVIPAVFHAKLFARSIMADLLYLKRPICYDYLYPCRTLLSSRPTAFVTLTNTRIFLPRGNFVQHVTESLIIISNICAVLVTRCYMQVQHRKYLVKIIAHCEDSYIIVLYPFITSRDGGSLLVFAMLILHKNNAFHILCT